MAMTLSECLARLKPNTMIYLGCKDGSGFFVIDYRKNILPILGELDEEQKKFAIKNYEKAKIYALSKHKPENGKFTYPEFEWVPLAERNIEAAYRRTVDIPGAIVLISGNISGSYWMYGEQPGKEKQNESKTKRRVQNK